MSQKGNKCCCCDIPYCEGCCGKRFTTDDWPATLSARFLSALGSIDVAVTMDRVFVGAGVCPGNGPVYDGVYYTSPVYMGLDNGGDETCCFAVEVHFICDSEANGDIDFPCIAYVTVFWLVGENFTAISTVVHDIDVDDDVCNLSFDASYGDTAIPPCLSGAEGILSGYTVTVGDTGGATSDLCPYECCESKPYTLYATISSDNVTVDGLVVELTRVGWDQWEGTLPADDPDCPNLYVVYFNSWALVDTDCSVNCQIGIGGSCMGDTQNSFGNECPPHTFPYDPRDPHISGLSDWPDPASSGSCTGCDFVLGTQVTVTIST